MVAACVGDTVSGGLPSEADAGSTLDAGSTSDAGSTLDAGNTPDPDDGGESSDGSSGVDAAPNCAPGLTACGSECVDLKQSADHCNACGRSCGGGECSGGVCSVATVREGIKDLHDFDVKEQALTFTAEDKVFSCDVENCKGAPKQLAAMIAYPTNLVSVEAGFVYFGGAPNQNTERPNIYRCPMTGCPNPPTSVASDGLSGISGFVTANESLFADLNGSGLNWLDCRKGTCVATGKVVVLAKNTFGQYAADDKYVYFADTSASSSLSSVEYASGGARTVVTPSPVKGAIRLSSDSIFFVGLGISGGQGVYGCPKNDCSKPVALMKTIDTIPLLAADDHGIAWLSGDKLFYCADIVCPGGPRELLQDVANTSKITTDANYLYFSAPVGGGSTIRRLRRP